MNRRNFLLTTAGAALALTTSAFAGSRDILPDFDEVAAEGIPVLIHVTAPWCGTCQIQKPIVQKLLGKGDFVKMRKYEVDYDTQGNVLQRFQVQSQSTMILYKNGKEIDRQVGETDPAAIEAFLRKAL
ncbi:thioredoxin [Sinorhizobium medicae]|nr:thioredoxin [Sinorhizobium medicae]